MSTEGTAKGKESKRPAKFQEREDNWARFILYSALFFAAILLLYTIFGDQGIMELYRFQLQIDDLNASIKEIQHTNNNLREEIRLLKENPYYIERIAREELGLVKPGEIIYYIRYNKNKSERH